MKHPANASPGMYQRCPHLGLHDDRSTSLAYPAAWNYCYRASPADSVLITHQETVCLTAAHQQCPVLLRAGNGPLPAELRGFHELPGTKRGWKAGTIILVALILVAAVAAFLVGPRYLANFAPAPASSPAMASPTNTVIPSETPTRNVLNNQAQGIIASFTADALTRIANFTPTPEFTVTGTLPTSTVSPTFTRTPTLTRTPTPTLTPSRTRTPSITPSLIATVSRTPAPQVTSTPGPAGSNVCGHPLDTPFGGTMKFLLHRILPGENLTIYADTYGSTTTAILSVNYRLPLPVWADWVVVIPFQTNNVDGVPPFEPYQAVDMRISLDELARQLSTDPDSLRKYNDFQEPCAIFSGWLLVPRPTP